jgi:Flp pilus assembly protein TadD
VKSTQQFNAAVGYYQLGMYEEAWQELKGLPAGEELRTEVLGLKISVLMQLKHWEQAVSQSTELLKISPGEKAAYIDIAYCLHELGRTEQAREFLLGAVNLLRDNATFHYNMACYEARLGNLESARGYLQHACKMDGHFKEFSKTDPDLKPLRKKKGKS